MTQRKNLSCVHEPFGDAFYYGPERLSGRYENDAEGREQSGFANTTYADVLRAIDESSEEVSPPIDFFSPPASLKISTTCLASSIPIPTSIGPVGCW